MKKKNIIIISCIVLVLCGVILFFVMNTYFSKDTFRMYNLKVPYSDMIYYEKVGSSSVERISVVYSDNGEYKIYNRYFDSGKEKIVEYYISEEDKNIIVDAINDSTKMPKEYDDYAVGGYSEIAKQYIDKDKETEITAIDLESLNLVKSVYDIME